MYVKCLNHNHDSQDEKIREKEALAEIKEKAILAKLRHDEAMKFQNELNSQGSVQQMEESYFVEEEVQCDQSRDSYFVEEQKHFDVIVSDKLE